MKTNDEIEEINKQSLIELRFDLIDNVLSSSNMILIENIITLVECLLKIKKKYDLKFSLSRYHIPVNCLKNFEIQLFEPEIFEPEIIVPDGMDPVRYIFVLSEKNLYNTLIDADECYERTVKDFSQLECFKSKYREYKLDELLSS